MIAAAPIVLSKHEQKLYDLLSDGKEHGRKELLPCLDDELASMDLLRTYMYRLRKKLAPHGIAVINIYGGSYRFLPLPESPPK